MAIERARLQVVRKPWGSTDLRPWNVHHHDGDAIGELWFQRADDDAPEPVLLLKLLFTTSPLSIQVHPDDAFARSIGLPHGKTEAWYVVSAMPGAKVAVGLERQLTAPQLQAAIEDGSIADLVQWRDVLKDDFISVPAGTIHSIGAGLVIAEIQQRSDATFRLYDYGRKRELHVANAVAAAQAGPPEIQSARSRVTAERTLLVASPHFVVERIDLLPNSNWEFVAELETWLLTLEGEARVGLLSTSLGEAIFLKADHAGMSVGSAGLKGLLAYAGSELNPNLLRYRAALNSGSPVRPTEARA